LSLTISIGQGGSFSPPLDVRFGDPVLIEWTTSQSVSYEPRYEWNTKDGAGYGSPPVYAGHGMEGNYTFYARINGTYTLSFLNDADVPVLFHVRMMATSGESGIDDVWVYLGLVIVVAVVALILLVKKKPWKENKGV
jgi:hypothetical protein